MCEHGKDTWYACAECRRTSHYGFHVEGGTPRFSLKNDDLPPTDEVDAYNKEHGIARVQGD